jgi:predicted NAD/FAD-binding protein
VYRDLDASSDRGDRLSIAVVGSGISALSAAWLLSRRHDVTVFEAEDRIGGHSCTIDTQSNNAVVPVDTGFIVYNEATYPNLTALFDHLKTPTKPTQMTFAVSLDDGKLEYSGTDFSGLFAQKRNLVSPRFWSMLRDTVRFYRNAPSDVASLGLVSLGEYLDRGKYGTPFRQDHLYPMAAAVWSLPAHRVADYPAAAFVNFCQNHGLLRLARRPIWRTVEGGSRVYVEALCAPLSNRINLGVSVRSIVRDERGVVLKFENHPARQFDRVIVGAHADQALAMLDNPTAAEKRLLGAFRYSRNEAILHCDPDSMPRLQKVWSSWNYSGNRAEPDAPLSVTYWMNRLQKIPDENPRFVTLNPLRQPRADLVFYKQVYEHPMFDAGAISAQNHLWSLQGVGGVSYCGAYFGAGFHEDGLQSGLAAAELIGGVRRPWRVAQESGRIRIAPPSAQNAVEAFAS